MRILAKDTHPRFDSSYSFGGMCSVILESNLSDDFGNGKLSDLPSNASGDNAPGTPKSAIGIGNWHSEMTSGHLDRGVLHLNERKFEVVWRKLWVFPSFVLLQLRLCWSYRW